VAKAEFQEVLNVDRDKLYRAISSYEAYPQFVDGVKRTQVDRKSPTEAVVKYNVSIMKDIEYTLRLTENPEAGTINWTLVGSDVFKVNNGSWLLTPAGPGKTNVRYSVEIEFKMMVPSMILNKIVKSSLGPMVRSFEKRALSGA
jgi:ribosome-associated toxin RatA of RatAB toxin-antitoxin module